MHEVADAAIEAVVKSPSAEVNFKLTRDPVCGMMVNEKSAKWKSAYGGKTYYFCNETCKRTFDKTPTKYVK